MPELTKADLQDGPACYDTARALGAVLVGEDNVKPLIQASSTGDNTTLQNLLSQSQWSKSILEEQITIYAERRPSQGPDDVREVTAGPVSNLARCLTTAAEKGHANVVSTLLSFASKHNIKDVIDRTLVRTTIDNGKVAVFEALAKADSSVITYPLGHGVLPLYEAVRLQKPNLTALLLHLGADPLHPVESSKILGGYNSSLLSFAAMYPGPQIVELLLKHNLPTAGTAALHTAARIGQLDTIRLLLKHGADVNEVIESWNEWTPSHFAASRGKANAVELLVQNGARTDLKDKNGKTAAELLAEH